MNIIVTSLNIFWMREYTNAKSMRYDYDKKKIFIVAEDNSEYSYATDQILVTITFN